jgi:thiosulfate/3-mercaptopyruvate sulfurtransferase
VTVLTTAEQLLAEPGDAVLLDVRWALGDPHGHDHHRAGHLPGAVFVDLETELAAPASAAEGRHPLPPVQALQSSARRWGLKDDSRVVVYDAAGGLAAARAWWLLRWGGLSDVTILDGGLAAWTAAGGELETGDVAVPAPGDVTLTGGGMPVLTADEAAALAAGEGVLLDARAGERYRGEIEPIDLRAGHVPGAVSAPTADNLDAGRFRTAAVLSDRFTSLGVRPGTTVGVYCGSGVTAAHQVAALAEAGIEAALWPGSWSQWSADPDRPVATGPS